MTTALVLYTPPALAIVPVAPARVERETTFRRKPVKMCYMPLDIKQASWTHESLLRGGWTPIRWEIVA